MAYETLRYAVEDRVATLTLHRPDRMNAFTATMCRELLQVLDEVDADDAVRALIVTGAGRAFCAGADLQEGANTFNSTRQDTVDTHRDGGGLVTLRLFDLKKPVIGAINGAAVGVGATMTLPMDVRIASDQARFGFVFARRGIVPEACSSWFLPRVVGISQAMEWVATGRVFSAQEAFDGRLVTHLTTADDLLPRAQQLAEEIADNTAPVSVALSRQLLWRMLGAQHPMEAHRADSRAIFLRGQSADAAEGVTSFLEKRPAVYPDRVSDGLPDVFSAATEG